MSRSRVAKAKSCPRSLARVLLCPAMDLRLGASFEFLVMSTSMCKERRAAIEPIAPRWIKWCAWGKKSRLGMSGGIAGTGFVEKWRCVWKIGVFAAIISASSVSASVEA